MIVADFYEVVSLHSLSGFKSMSLLRSVTSTVNTVCKKLKLEDKNGNAVIRSGRVVPSSVVAVKNGRRKMEDRHVVIHDLNMIFEDDSPQVGWYNVGRD